MDKEKLNWDEILIKQNFSSENYNQAKTDTNYIFQIGCIVIKSFSRNSFICFNKLTNSQLNSNEYFICEELNFDVNSALNLYSSINGPRFRITSIAGNESLSITEESFFFFGGIIAYNKDINIYLDDLWKFDLSKNSFKKLTILGDKISSRGGHSLTFHKDKNTFYLFGGKNESERFNDLYEINIKSLTNPPISRINHTATICKNSLYIFGGWDGTKTLNDMYELSLDTFIWYSISYQGDLSPPPVYRHTAGILSDRIVVFGGVNEHNQKFNELFLFDITSRKWRILPASGSYPAPRTFHSMCISGGSLYVFGGFSKSANNDCYSIILPEITIDKINCAEYSMKEIDEEKIYNYSDSICDNSKANNIDMLISQVKELKQRYENEVIKNICKICFEREINTVILDCCHRFVCYDCSFKCDDKCPLCKRGIKQILKTYN